MVQPSASYGYNSIYVYSIYCKAGCYFLCIAGLFIISGAYLLIQGWAVDKRKKWNNCYPTPPSILNMKSRSRILVNTRTPGSLDFLILYFKNKQKKPSLHVYTQNKIAIYLLNGMMGFLIKKTKLVSKISQRLKDQTLNRRQTVTEPLFSNTVWRLAGEMREWERQLFLVSRQLTLVDLPIEN